MLDRFRTIPSIIFSIITAILLLLIHSHTQRLSRQRSEMLCPFIKEAVISFYERIDPYDTTRKMINKAIARYQDFEGDNKTYIFPEDSIESLHRYLGHLAFREKKYEEAIGHYHVAKELNKICKKPYLEELQQQADYYFYIGWMSYAIGAMDSSQKYYNKHIKELTQIDSLHPALEETYNNLGLIYYNKEDYYSSVQCFLLSLNILLQNKQKEHTKSSISVTLRNISSCLFEMEEYDNVKTVMKFSMNYSSISIPKDLFKYNQLMAMSFLKTHELDSANQYFLKSDKLLPDIKDNHQKFQYLLNRTSYYLENKEFKKAESIISDIKKMIDYNEIRGNLFEIRFHLIQSKYYEAMNNPNLAIQHINYAIQKNIQKGCSDIAFPTIYVENLFKIAELQYNKYKITNNYADLKTSNSNYQKGIEHNKVSLSQIATDKSKILYKEYLYGYYKQYITQLIKHRDCIYAKEHEFNVLDEVIAVSDFCKYSIMYNSLTIKKNQKLKTAQRQLFEFLKTLKSSSKKIRKNGYTYKYQVINENPYAENISKYLQISPLSLQEKLSNNEVVLNYILSTDSLYCNLITNDTVILIPITDIETVESQISSLIISIKKYQNIKQIKNNILELSERIITPIKKQIIDKHMIYIISEGVISELPFDCLLMNGEYLIKNHIISECLSLSGWTRKNEINISNKTISAFAPIVSLSNNINHKRLPFSEKEIHDCIMLFKESQYTTFIGKQASYKNFQASFTNSNFVHISTHLYKGNNYPYLILNERGNSQNFYQWDITNKNIITEHLVLSTCNSGFGKMFKSEGLDSFVRSFHMLGIDNIIYTRWSLEDEFASAFFPVYYKNLFNTKNPSVALQLTKIHYINSKEYFHPLFWAAINTI